jgi:acetyl esterase/lipase
MRCCILAAGLSLVCLISFEARSGEQRSEKEPNAPLTLDLWPGKPPGEKGAIEAEKVLPRKPGETKIEVIANVSRPKLTVYHPVKETNTGAAVVIAPGGGYNVLAWDLEGVEVARWLNRIGVTGIVLKYRVPRRGGAKGPPVQALMDAQRAMSLVRGKAKECGIDSKRIGMLGFSAGGHLTAWASTNFDKRSYEEIDATDKISCRPDFMVLIYPAYLVNDKTGEQSPEIRIGKETPPAFFAHARDDPVKMQNSVSTFLALKKADVPAELHVYAKGGHGFGLRPSDHPCSRWPARCGEWLESEGWLKTKAR